VADAEFPSVPPRLTGRRLGPWKSSASTAAQVIKGAQSFADVAENRSTPERQPVYRIVVYEQMVTPWRILLTKSNKEGSASGTEPGAVATAFKQGGIHDRNRKRARSVPQCLCRESFVGFRAVDAI